MARRKKTDDQTDETPDRTPDNDDTFGLPEIEYEPINRDTTRDTDVPPAEPVAESSEPEVREEQPITDTHMEREEVRHNEYTSNYYDEEESNSPWPKILGIAALLLVIGAAGWYFGFYKPEQDAIARERAQQEEQARLDARKRDEERAAEQRRLAEEAQRKADSVATATPPAGTIQTLNERTGRYYVVVASAIDGDLIMDYAKNLSQKGVNAKIIAPYGNVRFHRLTVAEGETFASTQQVAEGLKGEYANGAWVIKY